MIYFDHNATTQVDERVLEAMLPYLGKFFGNPSSLYRHGRAVRTAVETAREQVAALVGVQSSQVVFTSGGTESNNIAFATANQLFEPGHLLIGATEHPSVREPAARLQANGWDVETIPVDGQGRIDTDVFAQLIRPQTRFVSVMFVNNETGVLQGNLRELADLSKQRGLLVHTDAVQAAGKVSCKFNDLGADLMSLSAHKIYGPKGVGALVFDKTVDVQPLQLGGGQEQGIRAGTENTAGIIGFGKAAELASAEQQSRQQHVQTLRDRLEQKLSTIRGVEIIAKDAARLSNTTLISCRGIDGEMLLMQLDQQGIAVSSGSACSSNNREPSPVLLAMGIPRDQTLGAIRISLGQQNTIPEVDRFLECLNLLIPSDP